MLDARASGERGPFASDTRVADLVAAAGYAEVRTSGFDVAVTFADAGQWRDWTWSHGQRTIVRFAFTPVTDGFLCAPSRYWSLDQPDPR